MIETILNYIKTEMFEQFRKFELMSSYVGTYYVSKTHTKIINWWIKWKVKDYYNEYVTANTKIKRAAWQGWLYHQTLQWLYRKNNKYREIINNKAFILIQHWRRNNFLETFVGGT